MLSHLVHSPSNKALNLSSKKKKKVIFLFLFALGGFDLGPSTLGSCENDAK